MFCSNSSSSSMYVVNTLNIIFILTFTCSFHIKCTPRVTFSFLWVVCGYDSHFDVIQCVVLQTCDVGSLTSSSSYEWSSLHFNASSICSLNHVLVVTLQYTRHSSWLWPTHRHWGTCHRQPCWSWMIVNSNCKQIRFWFVCIHPVSIK